MHLPSTKAAGDQSTGIGYKRDQEIGTDKHVFSIIGANMGEAYGDIIIILKRDIMQHPDFNMTITAGTSYLSKRAYFHRPWVILGQLVDYDPMSSGMHGQEDEVGGIDAKLAAKVMRNGYKVDFDDSTNAEHFHTNKLHPSTVEWEYAVATDLALQARLFFMSKRKLDQWVDFATIRVRDELVSTLGGRDPTVNDIDNGVLRRWYSRINAHGCIEGHMPEFVQFDYAEKIIMKRSLYNDMHKQLADYKLADGRTLASIVEALPDDDYGKRSRKWQCEYFEQRAEDYARRTTLGAGTDAETDISEYWLPATLL